MVSAMILVKDLYYVSINEYIGVSHRRANIRIEQQQQQQSPANQIALLNIIPYPNHTQTTHEKHSAGKEYGCSPVMAALRTASALSPWQRDNSHSGPSWIEARVDLNCGAAASISPMLFFFVVVSSFISGYILPSCHSNDTI